MNRLTKTGIVAIIFGVALFSVNALFGAMAVASIVITESAGPHVLHAPGGITATYPTHEACVAAAPVGATSTCSAVTNVHAEGVCDAPAPAAPEQADLWSEQDPTDDTAWNFTVAGWVPDAYPACWKLGRVPLEYHNDADTPQVMEPFPGPTLPDETGK